MLYLCFALIGLMVKLGFFMFALVFKLALLPITLLINVIFPTKKNSSLDWIDEMAILDCIFEN